jgi:tetratricopeptide (TPR) repeat protein
MALQAGTRLGPYEITAPIGSGGMGEVYRATDTNLKRQVAIKVLPAAVATDPERLARLQREAEVLATLNHPNIAHIHGLEKSDGTLALVMELVEGPTLADRIAQGPLPLNEALPIAKQIAEALEAAHEQGIIHRDLKPANIKVRADGTVKVLDFGLAKQVAASDADDTRTVEALTEAGALVGTPQYLAPELLHGRPADVASDLWALGVVLYEMLANRRPFGGDSAFSVGAAILHENAPALPSHIPAGLRAIVERCLAKHSEERYQRAEDVLRALEALQAPVVAIRGSGQARHRWMAAAAGLVLMIAASIWVLQRQRLAERPRTVTGALASANQDANDAFALAMQFLRVQNDIVKGQQQLERALQLDPHFAEARRYHAFEYVVLILNGFSNDASLLYKAEQELRQAEREDPALASLPSAFAAVYLVQGRKEMIPAAALDRATVQESTARDATLWRAIMSWLAGENETVKALVRHSLEREPLAGAPRMFLGETLRTEGDIAGAIREQRRVLEQAPGNISAVWWLTLAHLDAGQLDQAHGLLEEKREGFSRNYLWRAAWALLLASEGKRSDALEAMDAETIKFARSVFVATLPVAEFYALLGDSSKAIEWVEAAVRNGDERVEWFRRDPRLASIQNDPRFLQLLQSIEARRKRS